MLLSLVALAVALLGVVAPSTALSMLVVVLDGVTTPSMAFTVLVFASLLCSPPSQLVMDLLAGPLPMMLLLAESSLVGLSPDPAALAVLLPVLGDGLLVGAVVLLGMVAVFQLV